MGKRFFNKRSNYGSGSAGDDKKKHPFDIILLDARIPDMDGCQVCQIVRETDTISILMLSLCTELKNKVRCFRIGADDFLTKPFDLEELLARMNALMPTCR
ncbi:response regulator transcription factor [Paenibacillus sp. FSL K6-2859]|uniref:response regulator transcription factor n=1 Tax=Paenibacillus sp. FSL K6-2859 TaxID=2921482 RepID=UPI0030F4C0DD